MSLRNIAIVYRKELLDLLRDRRTIISMIIVPVLVMPLLYQIHAGSRQDERSLRAGWVSV